MADASEKNTEKRKLVIVDVSLVAELARRTAQEAAEALASGAVEPTRSHLIAANQRLLAAAESLEADDVCCPQGMQIKVAPDWSETKKAPNE